MFVRWSKWLVVLTLIYVVGAHWFLLQSAAWVGMVVKFSQADSLEVALQKTFDGQHPCRICKIVKSGKAAGQTHELLKLETQFEFLAAAPAGVLFPPMPVRHFSPEPIRTSSLGYPPLLPPPRAG